MHTIDPHPITCWKLQNLWVSFVSSNSGVWCDIRYLSETHLKLKSHKTSFIHNIRFSCPIISKICTAVSLPCCVNNFKMIGLQRNKYLADEISQDLELRWVRDGYPILHSTRDLCFSLYKYTELDICHCLTVWEAAKTATLASEFQQSDHLMCV